MICPHCGATYFADSCCHCDQLHAELRERLGDDDGVMSFVVIAMSAWMNVRLDDD
jgi:hypothetical protein